MDLGEIDLLHAEEGLHGAAGLVAVGAEGVVDEELGEDLPGDAEFVLHPATLLGFNGAAFGEPVPVVVDLGLGLTGELEGDGFVEFEMRAAIEGGESQAIEFKSDGHDRSGFMAVLLFSCVGVICDVGDPRVFEDADVKVHGFFGIVIEPEAGSDLGVHGVEIQEVGGVKVSLY